LSEQEVADVIRKGKSPMPGYANKLDDKAIQALARFIKALPAS
jgi:mono/diheme cytochrome c family protein